MGEEEDLRVEPVDSPLIEVGEEAVQFVLSP